MTWTAANTAFRATSIKTRIETKLGLWGTGDVKSLSEQHPLKQGLKPIHPCHFSHFAYLSEQHPLKQGLKLIVPKLVQKYLHSLSEQHPLKQGLKLYTLLLKLMDSESFRATSIKTRIETLLLAKPLSLFFRFRSLPCSGIYQLVKTHNRGEGGNKARRATSIKTRIETLLLAKPLSLFFLGFDRPRVAGFINW